MSVIYLWILLTVQFVEPLVFRVPKILCKAARLILKPRNLFWNLNLRWLELKPDWLLLLTFFKSRKLGALLLFLKKETSGSLNSCLADFRMSDEFKIHHLASQVCSSLKSSIKPDNIASTFSKNRTRYVTVQVPAQEARRLIISQSSTPHEFNDLYDELKVSFSRYFQSVFTFWKSQQKNIFCGNINQKNRRSTNENRQKPI